MCCASFLGRVMAGAASPDDGGPGRGLGPGLAGPDGVLVGGTAVGSTDTHLLNDQGEPGCHLEASRP